MSIKDLITGMNNESQEQSNKLEAANKIKQEAIDKFNAEYTKVANNVIKPYIDEKVKELNGIDKVNASATQEVVRKSYSRATPQQSLSINGVDGYTFQFDFVSEPFSKELVMECFNKPQNTKVVNPLQIKSEGIRYQLDSATSVGFEAAIKNYIKKTVKGDK